MKKFILTLISCSSIYSIDLNPIQGAETLTIDAYYQKAFTEPGSIVFTPPHGWYFVDPKKLSSHVKIMTVGKGTSDFPPNINLGYDHFNGTLKEYIKKIVKPYNEKTAIDFKDLGTIETEAGEANLLQIDTKTAYGIERQMQALILKGDTVYMLTASALKEEFPRYYKEFFNAMRSLRFNHD